MSALSESDDGKSSMPDTTFPPDEKLLYALSDRMADRSTLPPWNPIPGAPDMSEQGYDMAEPARTLTELYAAAAGLH